MGNFHPQGNRRHKFQEVSIQPCFPFDKLDSGTAHRHRRLSAVEFLLGETQCGNLTHPDRDAAGLSHFYRYSHLYWLP